MSDQDVKQTNEEDGTGSSTLQRHRGKLILGAIALSVFMHTVSFVQLGRQRDNKGFSITQKQTPVKIKVIPVPPKAKESEKKRVADEKKILETPQEKTQPADDAKYLGTVDHQAKKETRVSDLIPRDKAKDPGQKGNPAAKTPVEVTEAHEKQEKPEASPKQNEIKIKDKSGRLSMDAYKPDRKPRNNYEALLPTSLADLPGQISAGFQDYVDDKVVQGDRIDISTSEYRYIGYFTNMRKAIELVWTYPGEASRRGMQGEVGLEFSIGKDGKTSQIRVIKSSGYPVLDRAIVEAIKLASPFSPLPDGFGRARIVVTGSFRYILSAYGSH